MRYHAILLAAAAAALTLPAAGDETVAFKVVVHADNPTISLPASKVARLFMKKVRRWDDGAPVVPIDQSADSRVRQAFSRQIHGRSTTSVLSYWQRQILSDRATPPQEVASDAQVQDLLEDEPGAIGYVSADAGLRLSLRVLEIPDLPGHHPAAFGTRVARGDPRGDRGDLNDQTISRHGSLRLFLTGTCGPRDDGRQAVLQNRHPYDTLSARIETAVWDDGRARSTSVSHHTVYPLKEERLGCTRRGGGAELRFAIVEASSAASHAVEHRPHQPARSVIAIVDSGSCGRGRAGRLRSLINRHGSRAVSVSVEVRELVDDKLRRRYRKHHRLAPGATRQIGCSADASLRRQFTVLEADYP